jgi:hypothetical protein
MADAIIGGQVWSVTLPNFKTLRAAWRHIAAVQGGADPMDNVEAILGVVSVGSRVAVTQDTLADILTPAEMPALVPFLNALMVEVGLAPGGEGSADPLAAAAAPPPSHSTATSTPSFAPS